MGSEVWNFSNGNNNFVFILTWLQEKISIGCIISPSTITLCKSRTKANWFFHYVGLKMMSYKIHIRIKVNTT